MKKIYVIRHGRTNCNDENKFYSEIDREDINEKGIEQAREARKKVKQLEIDLIICSPLLRTRHTCEIINANNIPVIYDERIVERHCGSYSGKDLGEYYYTDYWNCNSDKKIEGMESIEELFQRVKNFLDEIEEKYKDKNILLVTHGGITRAIHFYFNELPKDGMIQKFGTSNCEIREYEI